MEGMLTPQEIALAERCIAYAREAGASDVKITLNKSLMDLVGMLDGEVDKVSHSLDRSLGINLYVDGRYGGFSSNRLDDEAALREFILSAVETVRMMEPDPCRRLPDPARKVKDAITGTEAGLFDPAYGTLDASHRLSLAHNSSAWSRKEALEKGFTILSEEGEYSDSIYDTVLLDSDGLCCRHTETSFEIGYEVTVADRDGNRFSRYWWDSSPRLSDILPSLRDCSETAVERAAAMIGPKPFPGGKVNLVVQSECASKLLNPLLTALGGYSLQQCNSFLVDSLEQQIFSERFTVRDCPRNSGETGAKWFDSEGVATVNTPIIEKGVVKRYYINTFIAGKTGFTPTVEDAQHPVVESTGDCATETDVLRLLGDGILVTGFNGGNNNSATGDFSYGIEGFAFSGGRVTHPVREMLMTGNFITLWQHLAAVAADARSCMTRLIPTLGFTEVEVR